VVNYIKYPANFEKLNPYKRFLKHFEHFRKYDFKSGDWLMVYVYKNDKAYDNGNIVNNQNQSYLYDFGGNIKKLETTE